MKSFIGLGSNLNNPTAQIQLALQNLTYIPHTVLVAVSSFYQSKSLSDGQPDYINAVAELKTELTPLDLLQQLQKIENEQGRERGEIRWAARTLDLDILLYGNLVLNEPNLIIPHPDLKVREFVLYPLCEIAPDLILASGERILELRNQCDGRGINKLLE